MFSRRTWPLGSAGSMAAADQCNCLVSRLLPRALATLLCYSMVWQELLWGCAHLASWARRSVWSMACMQCPYVRVCCVTQLMLQLFRCSGQVPLSQAVGFCPGALRVDVYEGSQQQQCIGARPVLPVQCNS
jgi:hypothetical protein